ncbi:RRP9 [Candida pseudojiufengensis]|uniref:RRP9 n=1 Tax=Candida pseudojiufengensis TaxID=497109 RepID=UPI00222512EA|nr:RRP9 [Candida pseudojiufengensis]KAI5966721.1 RRP9 [Candida pseudojiufengensis]
MAGDPFLSDPSKKRKRNSRTTSTTSQNKKSRSSTPQPSKRSNTHDEEISSDSDEEDEILDQDDGRADEDISSDEEFENETATDKRRRLAKQYLENLKNEELQNDEYDAQDLDDEILSRRLQVDVAETKGHVYKFWGDKISQQLDDDSHQIKLITTRIGSKNVTDMCIHYPYLYTVSKDIEIIKWNIGNTQNTNRKPNRIKHTKGGPKYFNLNTLQQQLNHHWEQINCIAASPDGKYIVTGGSDSRLIIWSSENLVCLKVLETRSAVNSISFRRNSDQLFAACADLRIRTFSINQFTQLEVLYGHQDNISDISSLARETCVSVGSRDKTAMFWKVSEETRLTFRGGDSVEKKQSKKQIKHKSNSNDNDNDNETQAKEPFHNEGSIDVVSMIDESHFVTGSDNGNIALWSLAKKKAQTTKRLAHGLQPQFKPEEASAESSKELATRQIPEPQPYWITAIHAPAYSNIFFSGSFGGTVKIWKLDETLRSFSLIGEIENLKGFVVKIDSVEIPEAKKLKIFVLLAKEHKFGRWFSKLPGGRNALVSFTFDI